MADFLCTVCNETLPRTERAKKHGDAWCRPCRNARDRAAYAVAHPRVPQVTRLPHMSREELSWLAGLAEGEGSFFLVHGRYPGISIAMSDEDVVRRCFALTGVGRLGVEKQATDRYKASYAWRVRDAANAYALMVALWPWLREHRRQRISEVVKVWLSYPRVMPVNVRRVGRTVI